MVVLIPPGLYCVLDEPRLESDQEMVKGPLVRRKSFRSERELSSVSTMPPRELHLNCHFLSADLFDAVIGTGSALGLHVRHAASTTGLQATFSYFFCTGCCLWI